MKREDDAGPKVRINTVITGEPAMLLEDWKRRGIINNYTDAVVQGIRAFDARVTEQDLKRFQLKRLKNFEEY